MQLTINTLRYTFACYIVCAEGLVDTFTNVFMYNNVMLPYMCVQHVYYNSFIMCIYRIPL